jgi:broad specificity phosphatase PhoE
MGKIVLVKHSLSDMRPDVPPAEWTLAEEGWKRCTRLAERLAAYKPELVYSSVEPKARQTAGLVAERLGVGLETVEGLHEHKRRSVALQTQHDFESAVAVFFQRPDELVMGEESAARAAERFGKAMETVIDNAVGGDIVVVTHGTVISLLVAEHNDLDPFGLWRRLGLPSFVVLSRPECKLIEVVEKV